jgi:hypothetical protein
MAQPTLKVPFKSTGLSGWSTRRCEVDGMHFFHVQDGRVVETWVQYDSANFVKTAGAVSFG